MKKWLAGLLALLLIAAAMLVVSALCNMRYLKKR